jgi:hypothetical protein
MLKLDLSQDLALLKRIQVQDILNLKQAQKQLGELKCLNSDLTMKLERLEMENREQFKIISEQNEVIQKYREILSGFPTDSEEKESVEKSSSSSIEVEEVLPTKTDLKNVIAQLDTEKYESGRKKKKRKVEKTVSDIREKKAHRLNELVDRQKIKYPTENDDYPDMVVGQLIWDTILRCFQKCPSNFITEMDIIKEGGKCLLEKSDEPFLDHAKITNYFNYPFKCKDSDKTMVIREYGLSPDSEKKSWVVVMPSWFSSNF